VMRLPNGADKSSESLARRLATTNFRPTPDSRLPTTDSRLRTTDYGCQSDLERFSEDQPGEHPDQGVPGDRIERNDRLQSASRRVPHAHPAEALVPALQP